MEWARYIQRIRRYFGSIRIDVGALFQECSCDLLGVDHDDLLVKETGVNEITCADVLSLSVSIWTRLTVEVGPFRISEPRGRRVDASNISRNW